MRGRGIFLALALAAGLNAAARPAAIEVKEQFSAWFSLNDSQPSTPRLGLRYQPLLSLALNQAAKWKLDGEFSLDASASGAAADWRDAEFSGAVKPYRLWLRLSSTRFEARLGLQKINFGSATLFRPLMWFDRIDPRDPLQVSAGVYGLLLRYYFKGNANAWLWGLCGNRDAKGWETRPTANETPEFGGRFQLPLFKGEAAATLHFRRLAPGPAESRFALDGKWDLGVGVWVEASAVHQDDPVAPWPWQRLLTLGMEYTFKLGNGLYLLAEQFLSQGAASLFAGGDTALSFSALLARYPVGLLDNLSAIVYYDWRSRQAYAFSAWQRTYDRWQFHVMAFWNPRRGQMIPTGPETGLFAGKGFQLMAVLNI
jgi:hypothetical protein